MPTVLVLAGPNGSGKSTVTSGIQVIGEYVNADVIQTALKCSAEEAAIIATATRETLLAKGFDFTFETVMSTTRNIRLLEQAKQQGYHVICIYILTAHPSINLERVRQRVTRGGHDVPEDKVVARYIRALRLLPLLFPVCDELYVFDNSADVQEAEKSMILKSVYGIIEAYPNRYWSKDMIQSLVQGTYPDLYITDE